MKKYCDSLAIVFLLLLVGAFFYQTVIRGKLPVPSDALVGLYYPYRDTLSSQYPNGIPFKNFLITDPFRQQIPWRKTVIESFQKGKLPLWDPYSFSGNPLLANIQSGAFYPLNILFFICSFPTAWALLIMSQPLLSAIFLFLFLRNKKLEILPSLFGAVCFAFSGFSIAWLTWGTMLSTWAWTPLSLLAVDKLHDYAGQNKNIWRILFIVSVACSLFAGHLQIFFYSVLLISIYALWPFIRRRPTRIPIIHIVLAISIAVVTSPLWISVIQWLPQTSRLTQGSAWTHEGFFIPIQHLIQFIAPDFFGNPTTLNYWGTWNYGEMVGYVGIVGLMTAGLGMSSSTLLWVFLIAGSLLFAVASPISALPYQLHVPLISSLQPTRLLVIVDFALSILAAYGLSRILRGIQKRSVMIVIGIIAVLFSIAWVAILMPKYFSIDIANAAVAKRNIMLPTALFFISFILLFACVLKNKMIKYVRPVIVVLLVGITIIDVFRFGWKFTPFTDSKYFFPTTPLISYLQHQQPPFRIMATDDRILPPNVNEYYGLESVSGYDPIHTSRYEEYIAAMERGVPNIQPPYGFERIVAPKNIQSPLVPPLNVRYVITFDELKDPAYKKVFEEGTTKVYELTHWVPRVYLAQNVLYRKTKQEIIDRLYDPTFKPGLDAVSEVQLNVLNVPLSAGETSAITSYKGSEITMNVQVENPRLVVIDNIYNDSWRVTVDGKVSSLVRVNYLFMGVVLAPGNHVVTLTYY
jgi:hypothetical protein